jgi:hypothetical protein
MTLNLKIKLQVFILFLFLVSGISSAQTQQETKPEIKTITIEGSATSEADETIKNYVRDNFAIISNKILENIKETREIQNLQIDSSTGKTASVVVNYKVPANFLVDTAKILWELNIPEFKSRLYQLYKKDTIYIDTWNNVVGKAATKTYTGHFEAFRLRNWPSWKDPEKPQSTATPPGPNNPLGLFVVHYDENSLRYFHGTNKNYLLNSQNRSLSHGCVRNDNDNIKKMKEFILNRVIKSEDLSWWIDSKKSMTYEIKEQDRFPVRIIYKTYNVLKDDDGIYIELYRDVYNYKNSGNIDSKWNDESLVSITSEENILKEFQWKFGKNIEEEKLRKVIRYIINNADYYEKYYINDVIPKLD